ncbi:MAG: hypothetical protein ABFD08_12850 [Syntrophomonas sp.]
MPITPSDIGSYLWASDAAGNAAATQTFTVTYNTALAVNSAAAATATTITVTFNRAPATSETLTYTVAGTAYTPTMDGAVATLTVPTMIDETAYAVVVNDGTADLYNANVTYDKNEITTITIQNVDFNKTIGNNFEASVLVADEDGDAVANTEVKLEAIAEYDTNNLEPAVIQTATTNANGIATFSWTTSHDGTQAFEVYSVTRPVVRDSANVTWSLADQLITVDAMAAVTLADGTAKEYTVTATDADGAAYVGIVRIDFSGDADIDTLAAGGYTLKTEVWDPTAAAWEDVATSGAPRTLAEIDADTVNITLTAAAEGTFKFRVYSSGTNVDAVTPTIYEDADAGSDLDATEARVVGSTITYVQGLPTITLEALTTGSTTTTVATADLGGTSETHHKDYKVTAVDQFGNPYRGTVQVYDNANADNLAGTTDTSATIAADYNVDGTYESGAAASKSVDTTIGGDITENDSIFNISLVDATAEDFTAAVFVDINTGATGETEVANHYDSNDGAVTTAELTFADRAIADITIQHIDADGAVTTTNPAAGGTDYFLATFIDQFAEEFANPAANVSVELTGDDIGTAIIEDLDLSYDADDGITEEALNNADVDLHDQDPSAAQIVVKITSGAAADTGSVLVYSDTGGVADSLDTDEISESATFTYVAQALTSASLTGEIANADIYDGNDDVATASLGSGIEYAARGNDALNVATIRYNLLDQSSQAYLTGASETATVTWTVTNNATASITVNDGAANTLAAGATGTYTTTVAAGGNSNTSITITPPASIYGEIELTAAVEGNTNTSESTTVAYTSEATITADPAAARSITGTIVGINKDGDDNAAAATTEGTIIIVKDALGQYIPVQLANTDYGTVTFKVAGNSVTTEAIAEGTGANIAVGNTIRVTLEGEGAAYDAGDIIEIRY